MNISIVIDCQLLHQGLIDGSRDVLPLVFGLDVVGNIKGLTQGSFRSVQLFGAGTHQVHGCAADIQQPVSCKTVLRQSPTGPCLRACHDSAAGNRQWSFCLSPETVWYARVLLLFSASAKTDTGSKSIDCALLSTMETYDDPENGYCMY